MRIRVHTDVERFTRNMEEAEKRQVPFALARALTWTAKDGQGVVKTNLPKRFTIRRPFVPNSIRITPATKAKPEAIVGATNKVPFMGRQETGGEKRGLRGHRVAVPAQVRRNKRDLISATNRPTPLRTKPGVFVVKTRSGAGILQRVGKDRYPVRILYWLKEGVTVKPRFGFRRDTGDTARTRFGPNFVESLSDALGHRG